MSTPFNPSLSEPVPLDAQDSWPDSRHLFDEASVWAIRTALAAQRPLLLRGEPGIGKSQLARAAAAVLEVPFLYQVIDERSERDDLLFSYDAVARLGQAQVSALVKEEDWRKQLAEGNFIRPGILWWAFDWIGAQEQAERFAKHCRPCPPPSHPKGWPANAAEKASGAVVLIDEIDKADPSLPNGLLEALGNRGFFSAQLGASVNLPEGAPPPLVMVTTNEERELPPAFLRRCLVHQFHFPDSEKGAVDFLSQRAGVFWDDKQISREVRKLVAQALWHDRATARAEGLALPGAAEYLDIVRVLVSLAPGDSKKQLADFARIKDFALRKNLHEKPAVSDPLSD